VKKLVDSYTTLNCVKPTILEYDQEEISSSNNPNHLENIADNSSHENKNGSGANNNNESQNSLYTIDSNEETAGFESPLKKEIYKSYGSIKS
jgi:hypothetical protein